MKCTVRNIFGFGSLLGLVLFVLGAAVVSNRIFYFASGAWIADLYVQGKGEASIPVALIVGIISSMAMGLIYIFMFCRLYNLYRGNTGSDSKLD